MNPKRVRQEWHNRRRRRLAKQRARIARQRKHRNRFGQELIVRNEFNPEQPPPKNRRVAIDLPTRLDLEENYEKTVTHMQNVRRAAEGRFRLRRLSFDEITFISPSAALLLASEVDRWNRAVAKRLTAAHERWDPKVRALLCEMGFFELLQKERPNDLSEIKNTTFLPFLASTIEDRKSGGQMAKQLRLRIEETAGVEIRKHLFFEGLSEAITNVSQHAYAAQERFKMWWMSAAYSGEENRVTVSFFDHGRGIPGTLPNSKWFEHLRGMFRRMSDGQKIRAAIERGRSSTNEEHRGKGLQNLLEIIHDHGPSEVRIYSGHGLLIARNSTTGRSGSLDFSIEEKKTAIHGTLIEWRFSPSTRS